MEAKLTKDEKTIQDTFLQKMKNRLGPKVRQTSFTQNNTRRLQTRRRMKGKYLESGVKFFGTFRPMEPI